MAQPTRRGRLRALAGMLGVLVVAALGAVTLGASTPAAAAVGDFDFTQSDLVSTSLAVPWGLTFRPDGTALVTTRVGGLYQMQPGSQPRKIIDRLPGVVASGEGGLLGLASTDQWIYAYYTSATDNRIVRFHLDSPGTQEVVLSGIAKSGNHNGGRIEFGPDGMLYAGTGDAGLPDAPQSLTSLNGKILRIRPDGGVPADNPFPGSYVYSFGHRNVQGLAWDAQGRLWATEFGQSTWDEVNLIVPGGNYGWPIVEGTAGNPNFIDPKVQWTTNVASPSGAAIVGDKLFVAALQGKRLWQVPLIGDGNVGPPVVALGGSSRLRTVKLSPDGWLWVTTSNADGRGTGFSDVVERFPPVGAPPDFSLTVPASATVVAGRTYTAPVSLNPYTGFTGSAALTGATGLPPTITADASGTVAAGSPRQITISPTNATPVGTYRIGIGATQGTRHHEAFIDVSVRLPMMPDLTNSSCSFAKLLLLNENLTTSCDAAEPAFVSAQSPSAGTVLAPGTSVSVTLSTQVPNLAGLTCAAARGVLTERQLVTGCSTSNTATVASQSPAAGAVVVLGTRVDLTMTYTVPSLIGWNQNTAISIISSAGLLLGGVNSQLSLSPAGTVIAQSPPPNTVVAPNSSVSFTVSAGGAQVPSLVGLSRADATNWLSQLGLGVSVGFNMACVNPGDVMNQSPGSGTLVAPGSTVHITIDSGTPKTCTIK